MDKIRLLDLDTTELKSFCDSMGLPKYRAGQIKDWLLKGRSFGEMTNLPAELRDRLSANAVTGIPAVADVLRSSVDETVKFLFELEGGVLVESVLMKYAYGYSVCISSQAGCKMGCRFCASAGVAFSRDLTGGELLGQIIAIERHENIKVSHVVIMGIGEPMDNYDNVVRFLKNVSSADGLNISLRKISLSTCGVVPGILRLKDEGLPVTLSVSLHNPFDDERGEIMPVNKIHGLDELFAACREYVNATGRRITFEYAVIEGQNDSKRHALKLAERVRGMLCHVNLIPVNKIDGGKYRRPSRETIESFQKTLESKVVAVTVRRELGRDINAACGQLRKRVIS